MSPTPSGGSRDWSLAIDFGTSFTTAAMAHGQTIEILEIDNSRYLPSLVCVDPDGELLVGRDAVNEAAIRPDRAERVPKRAIAVGDRTRLADRDIATSDLVAAVLSRVSAEALRRHGDLPPSRVVLTHPARWQAGAPELTRLVRAAHTAGLGEPILVPEPVAAAQHYVRRTGRDLGEGAVIAVYDLGGGTFDTAVLRRSGDGFTLAGSPGGDPHLGGEDLDAGLLELLESHAEVIDPEAWSALWEAPGRAGDRNRNTLRRDITEAKESLSTRLTVDLYVPGFEDEIRITRGEYEKTIEPILQRTIVELVSTIEHAGCTPESLTDLFLTGNSSRTPRITGLLSELLRRPPTTEDDPKTVVVSGALATPQAMNGVSGTAVDPDPVNPELGTIAAGLYAVAVASRVDDAIGPIVLPQQDHEALRLLSGKVEDIQRVIAERHSPFQGVAPKLALRLLSEARSELGELGRALTRLDKLDAQLQELRRRA